MDPNLAVAHLEADERVLRSSPVLIVGAPRSGSTWVEKVLGSTPGAYVIHEPDNDGIDPFAFRAKVALGRYPILGASDPAPAEYAALWDRAFAGKWHGESPRWLLAKALLKESRPDVKACFRGDRPLSPKLRVLRHLAPTPSHPVRASRIIVKSVHAPLCAEWIARRWPFKVVVIRRNPFNIVASYVQLGWIDSRIDAHPALRDGTGELGWVPRIDPGATTLARVAWQVGLFTTALDLAASRNPGWQVVSHEELCVDPEAGFRDLCADLGLPWTPNVSVFLAESNRPGEGLATNRVAAEQPDRWRRRLTPEQADEVAGVLGGFPNTAGAGALP